MGTAITQTGGRIPAARDDIPIGEGFRAGEALPILETMTSPSDPSLPGTRGRWLLLGLSSLFAVYLVLLVVQPAGTSEVVRWLYNILLVGAAFVCLTSPNQRGKRAGGLALYRNDAAPLGCRRLLLHALPAGFDGVPADRDGCALAHLLSHPLCRDRPARTGADGALRAQPLARRGARRARGGRRGRCSPVRRGCREHGRLAADRGDERGVSACRRTAARHGRRRPGDHRLAARPSLAVHPRQHRPRSRLRTAASSIRLRSARRTASSCSTPGGRSRCSSSPPPRGSPPAGSVPSAPRARGCWRCPRSSA